MYGPFAMVLGPVDSNYIVIDRRLTDSVGSDHARGFKNINK